MVISVAVVTELAARISLCLRVIVSVLSIATISLGVTILIPGAAKLVPGITRLILSRITSRQKVTSATTPSTDISGVTSRTEIRIFM